MQVGSAAEGWPVALAASAALAQAGGKPPKPLQSQRVRERIAAFSGYNENALEPLQVVRYHPGEKYEPHHDLFDLCDLPQKPRRHLTFLIYLNTMDENAGAHTTFPRLKVSIPPKAGTALVFNDVLDNGHDDEG